MIDAISLAFQYGLKDSLSVFSFSFISALLVALFKFGRTERNVIQIAFFSMIGWTLGVLGLTLGVADAILTRPIELFVLCPLNVIIALQFIWIGFLSLKNWYLNSPSPVQLFDFANKETSIRLHFLLTLIFASVLGSFVMAILGSIAGQNYYFFALLVDRLTHPQSGVTNIMLLFSYALGLTTINWILILLILWIHKSKKYSILVANNISLFRMTHSAWYLSVGFGIIFFIGKYIKG